MVFAGFAECFNSVFNVIFSSSNWLIIFCVSNNASPPDADVSACLCFADVNSISSLSFSRNKVWFSDSNLAIFPSLSEFLSTHSKYSKSYLF